MVRTELLGDQLGLLGRRLWRHLCELLLQLPLSLRIDRSRREDLGLKSRQAERLLDLLLGGRDRIKGGRLLGLARRLRLRKPLDGGLGDVGSGGSLLLLGMRRNLGRRGAGRDGPAFSVGRLGSGRVSGDRGGRGLGVLLLESLVCVE